MSGPMLKEDDNHFRRPRLDEWDVGSYLEPAMDVHEIACSTTTGLRVDPAPSFDFAGEGLDQPLCLEHAHDAARGLGFDGPIEINVQFQERAPESRESVMILRDGDGIPTHIAHWAYGRCCFEPGEQRSKLCSVCGVETLVDA